MDPLTAAREDRSLARHRLAAHDPVLGGPDGRATATDEHSGDPERWDEGDAGDSRGGSCRARFHDEASVRRVRTRTAPDRGTIDRTHDVPTLVLRTLCPCAGAGHGPSVPWPVIRPELARSKGRRCSADGQPRRGEVTCMERECDRGDRAATGGSPCRPRGEGLSPHEGPCSAGQRRASRSTRRMRTIPGAGIPKCAELTTPPRFALGTPSARLGRRSTGTREEIPDPASLRAEPRDASGTIRRGCLGAKAAEPLWTCGMRVSRDAERVDGSADQRTFRLTPARLTERLALGVGRMREAGGPSNRFRHGGCR